MLDLKHRRVVALATIIYRNWGKKVILRNASKYLIKQKKSLFEGRIFIFSITYVLITTYEISKK